MKSTGLCAILLRIYPLFPEGFEFEFSSANPGSQFPFE